MILSDHDIKIALERGYIKIDDFLPEALQPASVDLRLANDFLVFDATNFTAIDIRNKVDGLMKPIYIPDNEAFILHPGQFALGVTMEKIGLDNEHVARLEGKSSLGRIGVIIHATAGFIDPGNYLKPTLELHNVGPLPIKLYPGMFIAQVAFQKMASPCDVPYGLERGSHYFGDEKPKASQIHDQKPRNFPLENRPLFTPASITPQEPSQGKLIVIEGMDGAGKATQTMMLIERLNREGIKAKTFDFPQYNISTFGAAVGAYLRGEYGLATSLNPYLASLLYSLDRFEAKNEIKEALKEGQVVIVNRFTSSNAAFQGAKIEDQFQRDQYQSWLEKVEREILDIPQEDLLIFLDIPPQEGQKLVQQKEERSYTNGEKADQHEKDLNFLNQVYQTFKSLLAKNSHWHKINCLEYDDYGQLRSREQIHEDVWQVVSQFLGNNKFQEVKEERKARW